MQQEAVPPSERTENAPARLVVGSVAPGMFPRSSKVPEMLARSIVRSIAAQGLRPGAMLPTEAAMCEQYGVSRGSLREALRILEAHGLISTRYGPGGGPVVAPITGGEFARTASLYFRHLGITFGEVMNARLALEPMAARLAAENQDARHFDDLRAVLRQAQVVRADDELAWFPVANDFHGVVAGLTGNPILNFLIRSFRDVYAARVRSVVYHKRALAKIAHEEIGAAILTGDALRAELLMQQHMQEFAGLVAERFGQVLDEVVDWQ
jgi:DNA-binding FadR family transcriptional regulator